MMWGNWCGAAGGGWWGLMGVAWIVVIGLAVWLIVRLFPRDGGSPDPRAVLDARLAEGEITIEDYKALRAELGGRGRARKL